MSPATIQAKARAETKAKESVQPEDRIPPQLPAQTTKPHHPCGSYWLAPSPAKPPPPTRVLAPATTFPVRLQRRLTPHSRLSAPAAISNGCLPARLVRKSPSVAKPTAPPADSRHL